MYPFLLVYTISNGFLNLMENAFYSDINATSIDNHSNVNDMIFFIPEVTEIPLTLSMFKMLCQTRCVLYEHVQMMMTKKMFK